jgi:hypothetical protein
MRPNQSIRAFGPLSAMALCLLAVGSAGAQRGVTAYTVDTKSSLAWWQVNPNLKHLWATTCPLDPSWLPGEGRSPGQGVSERMLDFPPDDTTHIPLLERTRPRPVCTEAVHGQFMAPDTGTWKGAQGRIVVDAAALVTGEKERDAFERNSVLETGKYPEIVFTIDRVVGVRRTAGDSVTAIAVGSLLLHGTTTPLTVPIVAWHEAGVLRVRGRWFMTADELWSNYGISKQAMALGVGMGIWKQLWMGIDLVMRAGPAS